MAITLIGPAGAKAGASIVTIGDHELFFSRDSLVAYRGGIKAWRIADVSCATVAQHLSKLGCNHFDVTDDLEEIVLTAILHPHTVGA